MSDKIALVVGATGQDGAYLSRLLLERGYVVHGTSRDAELARATGLRALGIRDRITLHSVSPVDFRSVVQTVDRVRPTEIYNLAGQSSVGLSFIQPAETMESILLGTLNLLEAIRMIVPKTRFYNAGSSECFGDTGGAAADETTAFRPRSPYGVGKAAATQLVTNYRESYGLFACSGMLFNHESPLRPERFVTRKITSAAARIAAGSMETLTLGDISVQRDWGWAPDAVLAMHLMLQQEVAEDFVIATGVSHALEDFVSMAFAEVGLDWRGSVRFDPGLKRPSDIARSLGNADKARAKLCWAPSVDFAGIVARMMRAERAGAEAVS
jgi:GDPmannose 4,6-dehydratase